VAPGTDVGRIGERTVKKVVFNVSTYLLSFKPAIGLYGQHDPSAALFVDGELRFAVEEERLCREKHAVGVFPERAIEACLEHAGISLESVERVVLPYDPSLQFELLGHYLRDAVRAGRERPGAAVEHLGRTASKLFRARTRPTRAVERLLTRIGEPVPRIETREHHRCHAASAFHPSGFEEALVVTVDAKGEHDSTVVWHGTPDGLERVRTYQHPNSLGLFYAVVTEYLGYRMFNGEGKVMGLAPYGERDPEIEETLREYVDTGVEYDVRPLTRRWGTGYGVRKLAELFERPPREQPGDFTDWEQNLARVTQELLEEILHDLISQYADEFETGNVALAGGVALNCKANQRLRESSAVENLFVQPVAHDAGLALGAGWLEQSPADVPELTDVYLGPSHTTAEVETMLEANKLPYQRLTDPARTVAKLLADGALVGWVQGRLELGPRALGHRSILADPRTVDARHRINERVKHREGWRPFAPSIRADAVDRYLEGGTPAPFMIQTFETTPEMREEIRAVLHPADATTRPQTVTEEQNPRYYRLLSEFAELTGVPVLLNTSFNDNGEPIVTRPIEAVRDFYGTGLDALVIEDLLLDKVPSDVSRASPGF
jgi:carbamoyltransferase